MDENLEKEKSEFNNLIYLRDHKEIPTNPVEQLIKENKPKDYALLTYDDLLTVFMERLNDTEGCMWDYVTEMWYINPEVAVDLLGRFEWDDAFLANLMFEKFLMANKEN